KGGQDRPAFQKALHRLTPQDVGRNTGGSSFVCRGGTGVTVGRGAPGGAARLGGGARRGGGAGPPGVRTVFRKIKILTPASANPKLPGPANPPHLPGALSRRGPFRWLIPRAGAESSEGAVWSAAEGTCHDRATPGVCRAVCARAAPAGRVPQPVVAGQ